MSDLSPLSGVERKLDFGAVRSVFDPKETLRANFDRLIWFLLKTRGC
jgi:hypothetical protein